MTYTVALCLLWNPKKHPSCFRGHDRSPDLHQQQIGHEDDR